MLLSCRLHFIQPKANGVIDSLSCYVTRFLSDFSSTRVRNLVLLIAAIAITHAAGCASTSSSHGMRPDFNRIEVDSIAIVPFYAQSHFSLNDAGFKEMLEGYEAATTVWFEQMGFTVIDARSFQHHLTEIGAWQEFNDGIILRHSLMRYFEHSGVKPSLAIEVITLKRLAAEGKLPANYLLFGEVVYHSEGTCHVDANQYTSHVQMEVLPQAPPRLPRPCLVSHFQAKLVTAASAQTMWFNRSMREVHAAALEPKMTAQIVSDTIEQTFGSDAGIKIHQGDSNTPDAATAVSDSRAQPIKP